MTQLLKLKKQVYEGYDKRWNIVSLLPPDVEFGHFKQRVLNKLNNIELRIGGARISDFCQIFGIDEEWEFAPYSDEGRTSVIYNNLVRANNKVEILRILEVILNLKYAYRDQDRENVRQALELSNIESNLVIDNNDTLLFYPEGEKFLDNNLVNDVLSFLSSQPLVLFEDALRQYEVGDVSNFWKAIESLRKCLEEFLRDEFKNKENFENNKKNLSSLLKSKNTNPQISKLITQVPAYLDQYFNEKTKHQTESITKEDAEFLIYQTGTLLRYIHLLNQK